ncbi:MAG: FAD:protein FMN transferase [Acutalibacteraceae bacterium]|nr:FAD:protein FMN transferase [Acutalibacteraceae bacterium]
MKKSVTLPMMLVLLLLCGCNSGETENSETRFLLDTVCTVTADCGDDIINGAFSLCENLEHTLSKTLKDSDVYKLNNTEGFVPVSEDTLKTVERAIYYGELSGGRFDITIAPVSALWDFKNQVIPSRDEISEALQNVDYHSVEIKNGEIALNGSQIDLGGIAKGYIADKAAEYLKEKGVKKALVNFGGNIRTVGRYNIGIKKPFDDSVIASIELSDKCAVTSGIYERYIEKDGKIYHHILDPKTGYGVENELAAVTVIGEKALDCDALSTVCMLSGTEDGLEIINNTAGTEAVFIDRENNITLSSGLYRENDKIYFK